MGSEKTNADEEKNTNSEFLKLQYQVLSNRQVGHSTIVWGTPSILFLAQTILWQIALDSNVIRNIRIVVCIISALVSFVAWQGFVRNRFMEIADCEQLLDIEKKIRNQNKNNAMIVHDELKKRTVIYQNNDDNLLQRLKDQTDGFYQCHPFSHCKTYFLWELVFVVSTVFPIMICFVIS